MPDLASLHELTPRVRPRDLDELRAVVRRRRRTTALVSVATAGTALAVVVAGAIARAARRARRPSPPTDATSTPSRAPESTRTPPEDTVRGPFPTLTPQEVRSHPDAVMERSNDIPVTAAPGVAARMWTVCLADCSRDTTYQVGEMQRALEVTSDDFETSALFPYAPARAQHQPRGRRLVRPVLRRGGHPRQRSGRGTAADGRGQRARLRGRRSSGLRLLRPGVRRPRGGRAAPAAGRRLLGLVGSGRHLVLGQRLPDRRAGRRPRAGSHLAQPGRVLRGAGCSRSSSRSTPPRCSGRGRPARWRAIDPSGQRRLLHVSTDYGETWDVRVMPESWGTGTSLPDDWRTWVDVWPTWPAP